MQTPDRFTQGRQTFAAVLASARHIRRWLLPTLIVALALGLNFTIPPLMLQAQDGGTGSVDRVSTVFVLQVDTFGLNRDRLCIGHTRRVPVKVKLQSVQLIGSGEADGVTIGGVTMTTTVANASVVDVQSSASSPDTSPGAPFETYISLTGRETGSTTITIDASIESSVIVSLDEDVALPIPTRSQQLSVTISVRVVPCEYRLDATSIWVTNVYGHATAIMSLSVMNVRLTSRDGIRFESVPSNIPQFRFDTTVNRIRGCPVGHYTGYDLAPEIDGEVIDDELFLNIHYRELVLGDPGNPYATYYYSVCPITTPPRCEEHPDGVCHIWQGVDRMVPQEMENLSLPVGGGTVHPRHILLYTEQRPVGAVPLDGGTTIILTPILP